MGLSLTVLGTSGSYPAAGDACSGYLVRNDTTTVLLDAGPGTVANLQEHVDLGDLDAVVLTHEHPDHWVELTVLRTAWRWALGREGLVVYGTEPTRLMAESVARARLTPTIDWRVVADRSEIHVGDLVFTFARTAHPVETLAAAVRHAGRAAAYSADTGPRFSLEALDPDGRGFDLFLCEATFSAADEEPHGEGIHLSGRQAGAMAAQGGARRLVLTHLLPGTDREDRAQEAERAYGAPVELATLHHRYDI